MPALFIAFSILLLLTGCGQKGALYLPSDRQQQHPPETCPSQKPEHHTP